MPNRHRTAAQCLSGTAILVAGLAYFGGLARYGYQRGEDGDILQLISRVAHGQQPYIDFASGYTPLFFYWHAALLRLFNENLMAIRWSLVLSNSLTVWGLYALARTAMPAIFAVIAPLVYAAIIPVFPGEFCAFNVPYPAWYTTLFTVVAALAMVRWTRDGWPGAAAVAGIAAGLAFSFKPNAGLFALVAAGLVVVCLVPPPSARLGRGLWWLLTLGLVAGIIGVFGGRVSDREARIFLWPLFALVAARVVYRQVVPTNGTQLESRFVMSCVALGLGFAVVTVPWLVYFFARLGWYRFVHEVLFIGSGYEQFFFMPFHDATQWDYGMLLGVAACVAVARSIHNGRLRPAILLGLLGGGAVACTAYIVLVAPMAEGFQPAVVSRVQDLSFGLCLLAHWSGVALLGRGWSVAASQRRPLARPGVHLVTILTPAIAMFLGLYPRSDFMHLAISVAATLILGALLLSRVATMWSYGLGRRAVVAVRVGFAAAVLTVAAVMVAPAGRLWLQLRGMGNVRFVSLGLPRAPIVMEQGRQERLEHLRATVNYLERGTTPDDAIFPFPNLNFVNFLAGRQNPARQGYFQPGWPNHATEAEVVTTLRKQRPPYVVVLEAHELFITAAPAYYFMLRDYVGAHYVPAEHIGPFAILRRRDLPAEALSTAGATASVRSDAVAAMAGSSRLVALDTLKAQGVEHVPPDVLAWADGDDPAVQESLAAVVRASGDATAAAKLAAAAATPSLSPRIRSLYLRVVGEVGDTRAVPALLGLVEGDTRAQDFAPSDLYYIASKALIRHFWFAPQDAELEELHTVDSPQLRDRLLLWLGEGQDPRLRIFAAWATGVLHESRAESRLLRMLGESNVGIKAAAAQALATIHPNPELLDLLTDEVSDEETFIPSIIIDIYRHDPAAGAATLARKIQTARGKQLEVLCWIAATMRDARLTPAVAHGLRDEWPGARVAAAWALGEAGGAEARPALEAARGDPDRRVRSFAVMALETLAQRGDTPGV